MVANRLPVFFGCALDPDERHESIQEKMLLSGAGRENDDPYFEVMKLVRQELVPETWEERGSPDVPPWLRPIPPRSAGKDVSPENFVYFIDGNGCLDFAQAAGKFTEEYILPQIPCMIAVDHSLTGGVFASLASFYRPEDISLIVLDSHVDALPAWAMAGAIQYDIETNPRSVHDSRNPFLHNRADSYNAGSFLYYLLEGGIVDPENLFLLGVSDYPPKQAFRIKDDRIKRFVDCYSSLRRKGVKILTKQELSLKSSALSAIIRRVKTPYVYISIDMDIGARNALGGVRFQDYQGLNERQLYKIAQSLRELSDRGVKLAGMDVMEFNPRRAGSGETQDEDRTYRIAFNLIKTLCFRPEDSLGRS